MHPEAKREEEPLIREIETAKDAVKRIGKDPDAVWVPGLEPEVHQQRRNPKYPSSPEDGGYTNTGAGDGKGMKGGRWLKYPFLFGLLSVVLLSLQLAFSSSLLPLAFPTEEHHSWPLIKELTLTDHLLDTLPAISSIIFVSTLCVQLGAASDSFMCFMGVGVGALSFLAAVGDKFLLLRACPDLEPTTQCDLPLVLHWICNSLKIIGPSVAVFFTSGVWDMLLLYKKSGGQEFNSWSFFSMKTWGWILVVPLLFHTHHMVHMLYYSEPSTKIVATAMGVQVLVWTFMLFVKVSGQSKFEVRSFDRKKDE